MPPACRSAPGADGAVRRVAVATSREETPAGRTWAAPTVARAAGASGRRRMREGTSGRGASSATSTSTSRFDRCAARPSKRLGVVLTQVRRQLRDRAQVKAPIGQHGEHEREPSRQASRRDPKVRLGVRKVQPRRRIHMHRRTGLAKVQLSPVHLGQMPDQLRLDPTTAPDQIGEPSEQNIVGEIVETWSERRHAFIHNTEVYRPRRLPQERRSASSSTKFPVPRSSSLTRALLASSDRSRPHTSPRIDEPLQTVKQQSTALSPF